MKKTINIQSLPADYRQGATVLVKKLGLKADVNGVKISFNPNGYGVKFDGKTLSVKGSLGRGLRLFKENNGLPFSCLKKPIFEELGFLFDCAKNKIPTEKTFQDMMVKLALLGYTKAYIGVESEMTLDGEPYFGYGSFRFTGETVKKLDEFASSIGLELIPAVATLTGFIRSIHRFHYWPAFYDGDDVLCAGQQNALDLIGKIFDFWKKNLTTNKIHIGLDDTGGILGRWWYYRRNGLKNPDEIVVDHAKEVCRIAREKGFAEIEAYSDLLFTASQPSEERYTNYDKDYTEEREYNYSWCDSFHLFGHTRKRYPETELTAYVREKLDTGVRLCSTYVTGETAKDWTENFSRHRVLKNELAYGLPVKCGNFSAHNGYYLKKAKNSISACKKSGVNSYTVMFLNDYGGECSIYAHLPLLTFVSEKCYGDNGDTCLSVTGVEKEKFTLLDLPDEIPHTGNRLISPSEYGLYGDAFLGIFDKHIRQRDERKYAFYVNRLEEATGTAKDFSYIFKTRTALCKILEKKYALGIKTRKYYLTGNNQGLKKLIQENYEPLLGLIKEFTKLVKTEWAKENLFYSFEVQELHLGGLYARVKEQKNRLEKYLATGTEIAELNETIINETCGDYPDGEPLWESDWCRIVSVNRI